MTLIRRVYFLVWRVADTTSTGLTAAWRTALFVPESCHVCVIVTVTCVIRQCHNDKTSFILSSVSLSRVTRQCRDDKLSFILASLFLVICVTRLCYNDKNLLRPVIYIYIIETCVTVCVMMTNFFVMSSI